MALLASGIFSRGSQELQVSLQNVFDPEKNIAEPGPTHERSQRFSVVRDTRGHCLYEIVELVETSRNDGFAQRLETMHVEHDIVVNQEDGAGAVVARVANVGNYVLERIGVEVAAAHFDDRAETAVIRAAPGSLDHIHLAPQQCVALEYPSTTVRRPDLIIFQAMYRPSRSMEPTVAFATRQATDTFEASAPFQCP